MTPTTQVSPAPSFCATPDVANARSAKSKGSLLSSAGSVLKTAAAVSLVVIAGCMLYNQSQPQIIQQDDKTAYALGCRIDFLPDKEWVENPHKKFPTENIGFYAILNYFVTPQPAGRTRLQKINASIFRSVLLNGFSIWTWFKAPFLTEKLNGFTPQVTCEN